MKAIRVVLMLGLLAGVGNAGASLRAQPASTAASTGACGPTWKDSTRFAVIGDSGTGGREQFAVGRAMAQARTVFPFTFVLMLGDNLYGSERPEDYVRKFQQPYKALLDADVQFYASLGNHDEQNQRFYRLFNMNGERYYTFKKGDVRFFALDSNYMDVKQQEWVASELAKSNERWKVAFFHHPLYSSGARHGAEEDLRTHLEPLFLKYGINAVFAGHEHFYERLKPQKGIHYFTSGAAAKLRRGNIRRSAESARGLDTENSFMLVEVGDDQMGFQAITARGRRIDGGMLGRREGNGTAAVTEIPTANLGMCAASTAQ